MENKTLIKKHIFLEIETGDFDDIIAAIYCLLNEQMNVLALAVHPGSPEQIGMIQNVFEYIKFPEQYANRLIICASNPGQKYVPNGKYARVFGKFKPFIGEVPEASNVLINLCHKYGEHLTYLTLGPPVALGRALMKDDKIILGTWVAQGGFAGVGVMEEDQVMDKFKNLVQCHTTNFNLAPKEALIALESPNVLKRYLVGKHICHGIIYDKEFHERLGKHDSQFAKLFHKIMSKIYFNGGKQKNKKIHDILPCIMVLNRVICEFREVRMFFVENELKQESSEWGCYLEEGTNTFIATNYDKEMYFNEIIKK
jgi:inosine-uridine nucleoside N-ribohydrolase